MTQYIITYVNKEGEKVTVPTEQVSAKKAYTYAKKVAGRQIITATVKPVQK